MTDQFSLIVYNICHIRLSVYSVCFSDLEGQDYAEFFDLRIPDSAIPGSERAEASVIGEVRVGNSSDFRLNLVLI